MKAIEDMPRINLSLIASLYEMDWFGQPALGLLDDLPSITNRREGKVLFNRLSAFVKAAHPEGKAPHLIGIVIDGTGLPQFITLDEIVIPPEVPT